MSLLSPIAASEIHALLKPQKTTAVDLGEATSAAAISDLLDREGLTEEALASHLNNLILGGDTSAIKIRAIEDALKLHGHLQNRQDTGSNVHVNIIIQDSEFGGANPILVPR
jgi:hypothetical protein